MRATSEKSFTLIEMMAVIAIIGILFTLSIPMIAPMVRGAKIDSALDALRGACVKARSMAIRQREVYCVTALKDERMVVTYKYKDVCDSIRTILTPPYNPPSSLPLCPHRLENFGLPGTTSEYQSNKRLEVYVGLSGTMGIAKDRQYLPEGCTFEIPPYVTGFTSSNPAWTNTYEHQAWTYMFNPNGSAWAIPWNGRNAHDDSWSLSTYTDINTHQPSGPMVVGPLNPNNPRPDSRTLIVYSTTGQTETR